MPGGGGQGRLGFGQLRGQRVQFGSPRLNFAFQPGILGGERVCLFAPPRGLLRRAFIVEGGRVAGRNRRAFCRLRFGQAGVKGGAPLAHGLALCFERLAFALGGFALAGGAGQLLGQVMQFARLRKRRRAGGAPAEDGPACSKGLAVQGHDQRAGRQCL